MPVHNDLSVYIPPFLQERFKRNAPCFVHRLTVDIYVDHVFPYLAVEDIICLRRVDKAFFLLTHEPIIWKRFLTRMVIPLPPLRPTFRYGLQETDFEIEQLVAKAIWTDDTWRKEFPKMRYTENIFAYYEVLEMKLLPGGRYLVGSVKDAQSYRFYICVFSMDRTVHGRHSALARLPVPTKAFNLEAKFLPHGDRLGIMVMYSQRRPEDGECCHEYEISEWSSRTDIDPPFPLAYECFCTHIALDSLELLTDPWVAPGSKEFVTRAATLPAPFQPVIHFVSNSPIEYPSLFEANGLPYAVAVQKPNEIVIMDLTTQELSSIKCLPNPSYHEYEQKIRGVRVLPLQEQILVIRTIKTSARPQDAYDLHTLELFNTPPAGQLGVFSNPTEAPSFIEQKHAASFHISDYYIPHKGPDHPDLYDVDARPAPISIYLRSVNPLGLHHYNIYPCQKPVGYTPDGEEISRWCYSLDWAIPQTTHISQPNDIRVIPGVRRSLVYLVPGDDRSDNPKLVCLRRYFNPEHPGEAYPYPRPPDDDSVVRTRYLRSAKSYATLAINSSTFKHISERGFSALAWDESTGRICIASRDDMQILVIDIEKTVQPDDRFAQWRRTQAFMGSFTVAT